MKPGSQRVLALAAGVLLLAAATAHAARNDAAPALAPVASLDLQRYLGAWYEIARYPNRFQKHCAGFVTAQYSLLPDGAVQVLNRCRRGDGGVDEAVGVARREGGSGSARLKVRFAPAWLSFLPFVWADYWVIDLDPGYQWAVVSEPGRDYLWILSRNPTMAPQAYQALLERLARQGFDLQRLERTRQQ